MNILEKVKHTTRPWHDEMEAIALSDKIAAGTLSLQEYKAIVLGHYVFHREAEQMLADLEPLISSAGLNLEERMKSSFLEQDIRQLQLEPHLFSYQPDIQLKNLSQALGCMYVMEGATLGGTVIGRSLEKVPEITSSGAMHYYGCYGEHTGKRWKRFKEVIEQQLSSEEQQEEFVHTALITFKSYADCMKKALHQLQVNINT